MSLQPILVAGEWRQANSAENAFSAANPATREILPEQYPVSNLDEVELALQSGHEAVAALRSVAPEKIADFLELFAKKIEDNAEALVNIANIETALPSEPRLGSIELPRTTNQLRQAAAAARERSWANAIIDTESNIRSKFGPLGGPVVVFGPNNFPFAFNSAAGGDFAAAIAAGNPVIAKANTSHPGTTKLLTELAFAAVQETGLPAGMVQLIYRTPRDVGQTLVSHPLVGATGFTGSRYAGLQLKAAADKAGKPIYLEMSSVNPIFILPGALAERSADLANELYTSCSMGAGQFCTNPGIAVVPADAAGETFLTQVKDLFSANQAGVLLGAGGPSDIAEGITVLQENGAKIVTGGQEANITGYAFENTLLRVSGDDFLSNAEALQTEAFGTVNLMVFAKDTDQMVQIAAQLEGNLTGCLYSHTGGDDDEIYDQVEPVLREKVGRLLNDKMPTGVAVVPAMNHGGPFPATGHPGFTAVGIPTSMPRFAAMHSYDNVRAHRLPAELQDKNPTGAMWRLIDGTWSQNDI
ncbi:MAG: aldehyde dehydrogenase (NADP(+)) [Chloroflexota bacterium]